MMKPMDEVQRDQLADEYWKRFNEKKGRQEKTWFEDLKEKVEVNDSDFQLLFIEIANKLDIEDLKKDDAIDTENFKKVLKELVCGSPEELKKLVCITDTVEKTGENEKITTIKYTFKAGKTNVNTDEISKYFKEKYESLSTSTFIKDNLREKLSVCPYCNATYLYQLRKRKATGGEDKNDYFANQLDHYYPKGKYPYLAMSIFNLIPSCPTCNHIKGSKENHLHPYTEEMGDNAKFTLSMKCLGELEGIDFESEKQYRDIMGILGSPTELNFNLKEGFDKRVELKIKSGTESKLKERIKNSKEIFQLENKYSGVREEIRDLYFKHTLFSPSQREETLSQFGDSLGITPEQMEEVYFGARKNDPHKRPLSKFINDIRDFLENEDQDNFE